MTIRFVAAFARDRLALKRGKRAKNSYTDSFFGAETGCFPSSFKARRSRQHAGQRVRRTRMLAKAATIMVRSAIIPDGPGFAKAQWTTSVSENGSRLDSPQGVSPVVIFTRISMALATTYGSPSSRWNLLKRRAASPTGRFKKCAISFVPCANFSVPMIASNSRSGSRINQADPSSDFHGLDSSKSPGGCAAAQLRGRWRNFRRKRCLVRA